MSETTSSLAAPTLVKWAYDYDSSGSFHSRTPIGASSYVSTNKYWVRDVETTSDPCEIALCWVSSYNTFQAQYRVRKRYSPAHAQAVYGTTGEQWTDYSDWQGATITGTETATAATKAASGWAMNDTSPFATAYDFTTYDAIEWQARVRVYNASAGKCSEWCTSTLYIGFRPTVSCVAYWSSANCLTATVTTNWARGGTVRIVGGGNGWENGRGWKSPYIYNTVTTTNYNGATIKCTFPASYVRYLTSKSEYLYADSWQFTPALDGNTSLTFANKNVAIALTAHPNDSTVKEPVIELDGDTLNIVDKSYAAVFAYVEWTDEECTAYAEEVELTKSGNYWSGLLVSPPYDTELTIRAIGVSRDSTKWAQTIETFTIAANGRLSWTLDSGDGVVVRLFDSKPTISLSEELEGTTTKTAGRNRPLSRYGTGGTRTISCSAVIMRGDMYECNEKHAQATHSEISEVLRTKADMWFRAPNAGRYRVRVKSFSLTQSSDYEVLSVDMEEVQ